MLPGLALAAAVALCGFFVARAIAPVVPIPAIVIALLLGVALNRFAERPLWAPGLSFCIKTLLRAVVALLGLRIAISDVAALGLPVALLVILASAVTFASGIGVARMLGLSKAFGALVGAANAICGASAALAVAGSMPDYKGKQADVVMAVIAANIVSTAAMLAYPPLAVLFGFDPATTGILLGATIHDVAQVVGAGYSVSGTVGETAVIVKLFRVLLLLPVVLTVAFIFHAPRQAATTGSASVIPWFAVVFFLLSILNSVLSGSSLMPLYEPVRNVLGEASTWGMLIAIAALGLCTSPKSLAALGWRHMSVFLAATLVILLVVLAGLVLLR